MVISPCVHLSVVSFSEELPGLGPERGHVFHLICLPLYLNRVVEFLFVFSIEH